MSEILHSAEQDLADLGIIASYIWKPQRLFIKNPDPNLGSSYLAVDIISDGTVEGVAAAVRAEGNNQISQIADISDDLEAAISAHEQDYSLVKVNLIATYQQMYNYFMNEGLIALATIMATAIVNLNLL